MTVETAITEAWGDIVDRREPYFDDIANAYQKQQYASQRRDRLDGRFMPVYDTELDLQVIRAMARLMHERVPMEKARVRRLKDYTISRGFDWDVSHDSPEIAAKATAILEEFVKDNKWTVAGERDSFEAELVDGEFLAELSIVDGQIMINWLTSDHLVEPVKARQLEDWKQIDYPTSWHFGICTPQYAPNRPKWYHIVRDEGGIDWDLLHEKCVLHWKRNSPQIAKRGFSDAYTTHVYLGRADKVIANTAEGAAIQAAIAYIVEHAPGTTANQVSSVLANLKNYNGRNPLTGQAQRQKKIVPGQRVDIPEGMKYHAGLFGKNNHDIYIQVRETIIRLTGTIDAFPEHMLTGFAGNNNMASSLTAESPFVQGRLTDMEVRKMNLEDMFEKVLRMAAGAGAFGTGMSWEDIKRGLEFSISPPSIVSRDPLQLTQALTAQKDAGWVSDRTATNELGRDYDEEQENIKKQPKAADDAAGDGGPPGVGGPPAPTDEGGGSMGGLSRLQYKRNSRAIDDLLDGVAEGRTSLTKARVLLKALGLSEEEADALLSDVGGEERLGEQSLAARFGY